MVELETGNTNPVPFSYTMPGKSRNKLMGFSNTIEGGG